MGHPPHGSNFGIQVIFNQHRQCVQLKLFPKPRLGLLYSIAAVDKSQPKQQKQEKLWDIAIAGKKNIPF